MGQTLHYLERALILLLNTIKFSALTWNKEDAQFELVSYAKGCRHGKDLSQLPYQEVLRHLYR